MMEYPDIAEGSRKAYAQLDHAVAHGFGELAADLLDVGRAHPSAKLEVETIVGDQPCGQKYRLRLLQYLGVGFGDLDQARTRTREILGMTDAGREIDATLHRRGEIGD